MDQFIYTTYLQDLSLCDDIIEFHKNDERKGPGLLHQGYDPLSKKSTDTSLDLSPELYHRYCPEIVRIVKEYGDRFPESLWNDWIIRDRINVQHYAPSEGFYKYHWERTADALRRNLVFMTYLNDVTDAGETEFKYQKLKITPKKGLTVVWSADWMYTHRGIPSPTQDKYITTGWISYNVKGLI